jgi:hypothetical protein
MEELNFLEKQYLGLNKMSFIRRMALSIFCFVAYYWRENHEKSGDLLFYLGISILVISAILVFVLHFETRIINSSIVLDGLWTSRKVKIDINSIKSCQKVSYSRFFLNRSVYNLHFKKSIRFFTRGNDAVQLTDKDGQIYLIGSQKVEELERSINNIINS